MSSRYDISILTPSLNYGRFIGDAIESVASQRGALCEHIVADGGSMDETLDVLKSSSRQGFRWTSEPDTGQSDALNKALELSTGRWIGWLNADEFYVDGACNRLAELALQHPRVDVFFGDAVFVDVSGRALRLVPQHRFLSTVLRHYGPFISSCAVFIRRDLLDRCRWSTDFRRLMDWDLYLRLAALGATFHHVPEPWGAFRVHDAQVTAKRVGWLSPEHVELRRRHDLPRSRTGVLSAYAAARCLHVLAKALNGGYNRQREFRRVEYLRPYRWWAT